MIYLYREDKRLRGGHSNTLLTAVTGVTICDRLKFACDCMTSLVNHTNLTTTRVFSACEVVRPWIIHYYYYYPLWLMFKHTDKHTDRQTHDQDMIYLYREDKRSRGGHSNTLLTAATGVTICDCLKFACDCMTSLVNHTNLTTTRVFSACEVARPWIIHYYYPLWLMFEHTDRQTDRQMYTHRQTDTHTSILSL